MKKNSNKVKTTSRLDGVWLPLKQGIKGVFKYKIQLAVIILLSFLATLLLTAAMGTDKRISDGFNDYVNSTERFDYTYNQQVNSPAAAPNASMFLPIMDLAPNYSIISLGNPKTPVTTYNLIFSNQYLTTTNNNLNSVNVKPSFFTGLNSFFADETKILNANSFLTATYDSSTNTYSYNPSNVMDDTWKNNVKNDFFKDENAKLIQDTILGRYWLLHKNDNNIKNIVTQYLDSAISEVQGWLNTKVQAYFNNFVKTAALVVGAQTTEEAWFKAMNEQLSIANACFEISKAPNVEQLTNVKSLIYEFLFGQLPNVGTPIPYKQFIGKYSLDVNDKTQQFIAGENDIFNRGLRGMLNPIVNPGQKGVSQSIQQQQTVQQGNFSGLDDFTGISFQGPFDGFSQNFNSGSNSGDWLYFMHQKMAADLAHFNINFRNEMFVANKSDKYAFTYRFVLLQNYNQFQKSTDINLHIIKGRAPQSIFEVAISPQFARKNHININDVLPLESTGVRVVGYATDAYSFLPSADKDDPIPNVAASAIIYGYAAGRGYYDSNLDAKYYNNAFLTHQNVSSSKINDKNLYLSMMMDNKTNLANAIGYYQSNGQGGENTDSISSLPMTDFDSSNYRLNWTLLPMAQHYFEIGAYIGVAIIMFIALIACYVSVRKNIERNSSQIAILKALGVPSLKIALSYTAYGCIVLCLAVPFGWLFGVLVEWPISEMFQTFFSLKYNMILFDWRALLIGLFIFGGLSILISIWSAMRIIGKDVIRILNHGSNWKNSKIIDYFKNRFFLNAKFPARFKLQVTSSSMKKITLMSFVMLLASFLITTSMALPAIINNVTNSFYQGLKYKNSFNFQDPIYNAPFGKAQISTWQGPDNLEKHYGNPGSGYYVGGKLVKGYDNPEDYFASSRDFTAMPIISYDQNKKLDWTTDKFIKLHGEGMISTIGQWFGNNLYSGLGVGFSLGDIDGTLNWAYHSAQLNDDQRQLTVDDMDHSISSGVCQIMATIMNQKTKPSDTWQHCISDTLITQVPPYVANFVNKTDNRKEQFGFGWNYNMYQNNNEAISTEFQSVTKDQAIDSIGIDLNHPLLNLKPEQLSKMAISNQDAAKLAAILNNYASGKRFTGTLKDAQGHVIYAGSNDKSHLNVPVFLNEQARSYFGSSVGDVINDNIRAQNTQLVYKTNQDPHNRGGWAPILKDFWAYDDSDYNKAFGNEAKAYIADKDQYWNVEGDKIAKESTVVGDSAFVNPFDLQNNKFTFNQQYVNLNGQTTTTDNAYAFIDSYFDKDGKLHAQARPYYQYDKIALFLPEDYIGSDLLNTYINPNGVNTNNRVVTTIPADQAQGKVPTWLLNNPNFAHKSWIKILPYSLEYDSRFTPETSGLNNILDKYWNWFTAALGKQNNGLQNTVVKVDTLDSDEKDYTSYPNLDINYKVAGMTDTYEGKAFYMSNQYANIVKGYDTNHYFEYNLKPQVQNVTDPSLNYKIAAFDPTALINDNNFMETEKSAPMFWYNSKYDFQPEPFDLTTYYADTLQKKVGNYLVTNTDGNFPHISQVSKNNLLSEKQGLIDRMSEVVLSIAFLLIFVIIICAVLLILMISNLFVGQYERFMSLMKTEGYRNRDIANYTINNFTPFVIIAWLIGVLISWGVLTAANNYMYTTMKIAVPFGMNSIWWVALVSLGITLIMYSFAFVITFIRLNSNSAATLMREADAE